MKRPESAQPALAGNGTRSRFPDDEWEGLFPLVCEYLTTDIYEDGSTRERSGLTIKVQDGKVLVMLNDPSVKRSLYRVGGSLNEALSAIEDVVGSPNADWRIWKDSFGGKRGGRR